MTTQALPRVDQITFVVLFPVNEQGEAHRNGTLAKSKMRSLTECLQEALMRIRKDRLYAEVAVYSQGDNWAGALQIWGKIVHAANEYLRNHIQATDFIEMEPNAQDCKLIIRRYHE